MIWPFKRHRDQAAFALSAHHIHRDMARIITRAWGSKPEPPVFDWRAIGQDLRNAEANERRRAIAITRAADLRARYQSRPRQKKVIA